MKNFYFKIMLVETAETEAEAIAMAVDSLSQYKPRDLAKRLELDAVEDIAAPSLLEAARDALMQFEHNGDESPEDRAVLDRLQAAISAAVSARSKNESNA